MTAVVPPPRQRTLFPDHVGERRAALFGKVTRQETPAEGGLPRTLHFTGWDGAGAAQWSPFSADGVVFTWEDANTLAGRLGGTPVVQSTC